MTAAEELAICKSLRNLTDLFLELVLDLEAAGVMPKVRPVLKALDGGKAKLT